MATEDPDQHPDKPQPTHHDTADTRPHPPDPAADPTFPTPEDLDIPVGTEQPPAQQPSPTERADWEYRWRETPYDSYEDARHNVSHVGDPNTDYEYVFEPDDHQSMSGESVRRRGTDEWSDHISLY
jgi:hypothetical protein